jgi:hypothetical protein
LVYEIDPLEDPRWPEFLNVHPGTSVFHTRGWLTTIRRTYGHRPLVLTTSGPNEDLANGVVTFRVNSRLTGRRLVSIPFSDHCDPLAESAEDLRHLILGLQELGRAENCDYVELRPSSALTAPPFGFHSCATYYLHRLDLRPGADKLFQRFHRDCIQRKISRAGREGIEITQGRDPEIVRNFFRLVLRTRRRQGLPPQPLAWFGNLMDEMGESATIRCAYKEGQLIVGILTLQHGKSMYYKYGASDERFHRFGAVPSLLWHAIQDAVRSGLQELDMGRSECDNPGLITFKNRWNAEQSALSYWRFPAEPSQVMGGTWSRKLAQRAFSYMPDNCLAAVGALLYRHIA